jgi:uncharacterized membrane protein
MSAVRRLAIFVIVAAAIVTVLAGAAFVAFVAADHDVAAGWRAVDGVLGVGIALVAGMCAYLALRDLASGRLSARSEWWTWAATLAFTVAMFATVWFFWLGFLGPIVTALFVRLARAGARPAAS